jgi:uncharacterized membrane protein YfcA
MGLDFNLSKAMGLFINGITTLSLTLQNFKNNLIKFKEILPLFLISLVFAFLGAHGSCYIPQSVVKTIFALFIVLSLTLLLFGHIKSERSGLKSTPIVLYFIVMLIAFTGGLIGVGGGAIYLPLFLYLGIKTRESIAMTSALIPVVSFSAFFTYSSFVTIDWLLLLNVAIAAILGAFFAQKISKKIKNEKYLKIFISLLLVLIAVDMIYLQVIVK